MSHTRRLVPATAATWAVRITHATRVVKGAQEGWGCLRALVHEKLIRTIHTIIEIQASYEIILPEHRAGGLVRGGSVPHVILARAAGFRLKRVGCGAPADVCRK